LDACLPACFTAPCCCFLAAAPSCCSGVDKAAKNADDKTAFEVAQLNEQDDVMKLLE
jgi:hypothetical protein